MKSIVNLYKIGCGPSSSHTMGPQECARIMLTRYSDCDYFETTLYGSLALTGKGHLTDYIIKKTFESVNHKVIFDYQTVMKHPNTLIIKAFKNKELIKSHTFYSVGGGSIEIEGEAFEEEPTLYKITTFDKTYKHLKKNNLSLLDYIISIETKEIYNHLENVYDVMKDSVMRGISKEGVLPGKLKVVRKASTIYKKCKTLESKIFAYAYGVNEENASGGLIVTAPTCGASGVLPSLAVSLEETGEYTRKDILNGLLIAGFFGNLVKHNASISGAEAGCQAEVGTASSMGAAFICYMLGGSLESIEQAAEMALEHHLGLTCDPVLGYVQIPCIERNAVCAKGAYDCAKLSLLLDEKTSKITFDVVCKTMLETGRDINHVYRETSIGGLAKNYGGNDNEE